MLSSNPMMTTVSSHPPDVQAQLDKILRQEPNGFPDFPRLSQKDVQKFEKFLVPREKEKNSIVNIFFHRHKEEEWEKEKKTENKKQEVQQEAKKKQQKIQVVEVKKEQVETKENTAQQVVLKKASERHPDDVDDEIIVISDDDELEGKRNDDEPEDKETDDANMKNINSDVDVNVIDVEDQVDRGHSAQKQPKKHEFELNMMSTARSATDTATRSITPATELQPRGEYMVEWLYPLTSTASKISWEDHYMVAQKNPQLLTCYLSKIMAKEKRSRNRFTKKSKSEEDEQDEGTKSDIQQNEKQNKKEVDAEGNIIDDDDDANDNDEDEDSASDTDSNLAEDEEIQNIVAIIKQHKKRIKTEDENVSTVELRTNTNTQTYPQMNRFFAVRKTKKDPNIKEKR